jgi:hypothetical protein
MIRRPTKFDNFAAAHEMPSGKSALRTERKVSSLPRDERARRATDFQRPESGEI